MTKDLHARFSQKLKFHVSLCINSFLYQIEHIYCGIARLKMSKTRVEIYYFKHSRYSHGKKKPVQMIDDQCLYSYLLHMLH